MQPDSVALGWDQGFAFLRSSQMKLLLLLLHGPHFQNQESENKDSLFSVDVVLV